MPDWAALRHAYGIAVDVPAMIDAWAQDPSEDQLHDLWSRLCHQGTVYSASFEAIPLLVEACDRVAPRHRRSALLLIAGIWASDDRCDGARPSEQVEQLLPTLRQMAEAGLGDPEVDAKEFPYLLQAAACFSGDMFWGRHIDQLAGGEFPGVCPKCESDFFIAVGEHGYFASVTDYVRFPDAKRNAITPAKPFSMPEDGRWLYERAMQHGQAETATGVAHMFGTMNCPKCEASISVVDAIRLAGRGWGWG